MMVSIKLQGRASGQSCDRDLGQVNQAYPTLRDSGKASGHADHSGYNGKHRSASEFLHLERRYAYFDT